MYYLVPHDDFTMNNICKYANNALVPGLVFKCKTVSVYQIWKIFIFDKKYTFSYIARNAIDFIFKIWQENN